MIRYIAAALALAQVACGSARDAEAQRSAAQVARAVQLLRDASNAHKAVALETLAKLPCAAPDVCATRDACTTGYALHVEAITLTAAVKQRLGDGQAAAAARLLNAAEQKLREANAKVLTCTDREAALRRRYQL